MSMEVSATALDAFVTAQNVAAQNLANLNTAGYEPSRVTLEERPDQGGVAVQDQAQGQAPPPQPDAAQQLAAETARQAAGDRPAEEDPAAAQPAAPSGVDPAREMVDMIQNQRALEANAAAMRAVDQMRGAVMDLAV